jgi:hypothetical protein
VTVSTTPFIVPADFVGNADYRPLGFRLHRITVAGEVADRLTPAALQPNQRIA